MSDQGNNYRAMQLQQQDMSAINAASVRGAQPYLDAVVARASRAEARVADLEAAMAKIRAEVTSDNSPGDACLCVLEILDRTVPE